MLDEKLCTFQEPHSSSSLLLVATWSLLQWIVRTYNQWPRPQNCSCGDFYALTDSTHTGKRVKGQSSDRYKDNSLSRQTLYRMLVSSHCPKCQFCLFACFLLLLSFLLRMRLCRRRRRRNKLTKTVEQWNMIHNTDSPSNRQGGGEPGFQLYVYAHMQVLPDSRFPRFSNGRCTNKNMIYPETE